MLRLSHLFSALAVSAAVAATCLPSHGGDNPGNHGHDCQSDDDDHDDDHGHGHHGKGDDHKEHDRKPCGTATSTSTATHTSTGTSTSTATSGQYNFPVLPGRVCTVDRFTQKSNGQQLKKVDILFVMDHSGSMQDDWERVAQNVESLVRQLPRDSDVRYSVLLGDVGTWSGKLFSAPGLPAVLDNQKMSVREISHHLHKTFVEGMKISDPGTGEALFYSLYYAVTSNAVANQKLGFFRPDAALSVIFMSDEQEIGYPFPSHADLAAQGLPIRCDEASEDAIKKQYYDAKGLNLDATYNAVKKLKGDMPVKTHAFINITKDDLFRRNSKNAKCLYDSIGYGYPEMVAKTKGVLFSIQDDKADGLAKAGIAIAESLSIQHDFTLSKPANKVDPATILAAVDLSLVNYSYNAGTNSVHIDDAGHAGSLVEIRHCEPNATQVAWNLTGFAGTPAQYSVGLSWQTAEHATSGRVLYGLAANALNQSLDDANVATSHAVTVNGLNPNTLYYFQVVASDEFGQTKSSSVLSFRTLPDFTITGVVGQAARTTATVQWGTPEYPTTGRLLWGLDPAALNNQSADTAASVDHTVALAGLTPNTQYFYQCVSRDEFGLEKRSAVLSVTTQPDWGITGFAGQATRSAVALAWATTDQATTGAVLYGTSATNLTQQVNEVGQNTNHAVVVSGLSPSTDYYFQAVDVDPSGRQKTSAVILVRTADDWTIGGFAGTSTQTSVALSWTTLGYATSGRVYWGLDGTSLTNQVADTNVAPTHAVNVTGLTADTLYYFQAASVDSDGIEKRSAVVAVRTQPVPLPTWDIAGFAGTSTDVTATLSWTTLGYPTSGKILWGTSLASITNEVAEAASGTNHSVTVTGLTADTIYYFQAVSTDDRGQTKSSDVIPVRTMTDTVITPPTNWVISGFDGTTTAADASLIWQTPGAQTKATVMVGLSPSDLTLMTLEFTDYSETHLITVPGLSPNTTYYFKVVAVDSTGRTAESVVISKTTKTQ